MDSMRLGILLASKISKNTWTINSQNYTLVLNNTSYLGSKMSLSTLTCPLNRTSTLGREKHASSCWDTISLWMKILDYGCLK